MHERGGVRASVDGYTSVGVSRRAIPQSRESRRESGGCNARQKGEEEAEREGEAVDGKDAAALVGAANDQARRMGLRAGEAVIPVAGGLLC